MKEQVTVLIDADSIIFASAVTSDTFEDAKDKYDYKINEILDLMSSLYEIDGFSVFSGSKGNFRKRITPSYKANRRDMEIPVHLNALNAYSKEFWSAKYVYGAETDDLIASYWQKLTREGKNVIIVDDMVDTAGTLTKAADLMVERGAKSVRAIATHALLSGDAYEKIEKSKNSRNSRNSKNF